MRGLKAAATYHENNTGLAYTPFKIKDDAKDKSAVVRVLSLADYSSYNEESGEPTDPSERVIQSLFMHNQFKVIAQTRCTSNDNTPDPVNCPLCRVGCPRSLKTYIPVRVRGDEPTDRVQMIEYGRNHLNEVQSIIEELPNADITSCDFKIKRIGKDKATEYKWYIVPNTTRPLDDDELKLEVPDMEEVIKIKDDGELEQRAIQFERWKKAADSKVDKPADGAAEEPARIPF